MPLPEFLERRWSEAAIEMVRDALDAFVDSDVGRGPPCVPPRDDEVDALQPPRDRPKCYEEVRNSLPRLFDPALQLCLSASRHIERIADHATNIAEDVIYLVEGRSPGTAAPPPRFEPKRPTPSRSDTTPAPAGRDALARLATDIRIPATVTT